MRSIKEEIKTLREGECFLYNEKLCKCVRFKDIFTAAKNALNNNRSEKNGWKLIDDLEIEYPYEEWADLANIDF